MIARIKTFSNLGLLGNEITVEADSNKSLPSIEIIGLPDATIREAKERIRATFRNVGIELPKRKFILNLSPSDLKKVGTAFDLPMAVALLALVAEVNFLFSAFSIALMLTLGGYLMISNVFPTLCLL